MAKLPPHPMQPLVKVEGVIRFRENQIVRYLLESGRTDLNMLARLTFSNEDREQFAQLIGYSVGGFGELSYVSDAAYEKAYVAMKALRSAPRLRSV